MIRFLPSEVDELVTFLDVTEVAATWSPPAMRLVVLVPRSALNVASADVWIMLMAIAAPMPPPAPASETDVAEAAKLLVFVAATVMAVPLDRIAPDSTLADVCTSANR